MADEHEHDEDDQHDHDGDDHDGAHDGDRDREQQQEDAELEARRRIALAQIRQYGDPALQLTAREVGEFDDDLRRLVDRMVELMHDAQGVGLAATQVGVLRRLFVFEPGDDGPRAIVNPQVTRSGGEDELEDEGCLSLQGVRVPVSRPSAITLEGKDPEGGDLRLELEGYGARVAQHELDHLDGVLIIDRTDDESRRAALATLRPRVALR